MSAELYLIFPPHFPFIHISEMSNFHGKLREISGNTRRVNTWKMKLMSMIISQRGTKGRKRRKKTRRVFSDWPCILTCLAFNAEVLETRWFDQTNLRQQVLELLHCLHKVGPHTDRGSDCVGMNVHQKHLDCHTWISDTQSGMLSHYCQVKEIL